MARAANQIKTSRPVKNLTPLKIYLLGYNVVSALLWANLLYITISFLLSSHKPSSDSTSYLARIASQSAFARRVLSYMPPPLSHLGGSYNYKNLGYLTKWTQTLAVLEVVHAALGWVRSPVLTTASQVASRVYTVWGVVEAVPKVCPSLAIANVDPLKPPLYNYVARLVSHRSHTIYLLRHLITWAQNPSAGLVEIYHFPPSLSPRRRL